MGSPRLTDPVPPGPEAPPAGIIHTAKALEIEAEPVRAQLERILGSTVFRSSRRNSALLRHVVERTLAGHPEDLKERSIGIDVFGRTADYDTNTDHIVRSVAGEVRRRLAQYYMESGREAELRIELQAGSYLPHFRWPSARPETSRVVPLPGETRKMSPLLWRSLRWMALIGVGALGATATVALLPNGHVIGPRTSYERFWNPVFATSNPVMLCVGGGGAAAAPQPDQTMGDFDRQPFRRMHTSDALALVAVSNLVQSSGKPYRILNRASGTSFKELQSGPFVLIGGLNNEWTLRLTSGLRFSFERQGSRSRLVDKQNPANTTWAVDFGAPMTSFDRDYAIISRVRDPETEQTAVVVAGLGSWGTLAAGEFVTSPEHLRKLEAFAPKHWEQKNVQVVIGTDVIRGSSGPPSVLAAHFW